MIAIATGVSACGFSPLAHRINVGDEPVVVFVGEGIDRNTDLFAVRSGGGDVVQVTFTPLIEQHPRLTPPGDVVAFLRMRDTLPSTPRDVVIMNLRAGGEFLLPLPSEAGQPRALGWNRDGSRLYFRTDRGLWQSAPSPDSLPAAVPGKDTVLADSALDIWLGQPPFARVVGCATGGLCIIGPAGDTSSLAPHGTDVIRWGDDSVGWFENAAIVVRSLGPGRARPVRWNNPPAQPRDGNYAKGRALAGSGR